MNKLTLFTAFALLFCMVGSKAQQVGKVSKRGLKYLEYVPEKEVGTEKLPLLLFFHGMGERGNDLSKIKLHGPPSFLDDKKDFPFIVVSPQCPDTTYWGKGLIIPFVKEMIKKYPIDKNRVYITGLSMGGFGTWDAIIAKPKLFAAAVPICGGGETGKIKRIKSMPIWVFHGARDKVVPMERSDEMVNALKELGSKVKYTVYPDATHDSWTETYNNPELYKWFLEQNNK